MYEPPSFLISHIPTQRVHTPVDLRPLSIATSLLYLFEIWTFFHIYGAEGAYTLAIIKGSTWTMWVWRELPRV